MSAIQKIGAAALAGASLWIGCAAAAAPNFNGVWQASANITALRTSDGKLPPLLPEAKKIYEQHLAARKAGDTSFDNTARCQPPGVPRAYFMGMPFEIQQDDKAVNVLFQWNRLYRIVDLGLTHEQQNLYAPTYFGFATGNWEGDTLVIDTVLYNDTTVLDEAGLPHSMDLHTVERWQLKNGGKTIEAAITIEDPQNYSAPWTFKTQFKRLPVGTEIQEDVCLERLKLIRRS